MGKFFLFQDPFPSILGRKQLEQKKVPTTTKPKALVVGPLKKELFLRLPFLAAVKSTLTTSGQPCYQHITKTTYETDHDLEHHSRMNTFKPRHCQIKGYC